MNTDQLPFIERNFHIMNEDRFIMEKISLPIEMQDGEDIHAAINRTRETIVQNFNAAYPNVYPYLNFYVVKQMRVNGNDEKENWLENNMKEQTANFHKQNTDVILAGNPTTEKINKGTIEEQIEACTEIELPNGLLSFEYLASMNKKVKEVYDKKLKELSNAKEKV